MYVLRNSVFRDSNKSNLQQVIEEVTKACVCVCVCVREREERERERERMRASVYIYVHCMRREGREGAERQRERHFECVCEGVYTICLACVCVRTCRRLKR